MSFRFRTWFNCSPKRDDKGSLYSPPMSFSSLRDISTAVDSPIITTRFILDDEGDIDKLEYGMGLRRGGIADYYQSPSLLLDVHEDMAKLMRNYKWALLPTMEVLQSIIDLLLFNFNQLPSGRRHFTQDLPEREYEYLLLPPLELTSGALIPFYLDSAPIKNPRRPLRIKSHIHPCFVLPSLVHHELFPRNQKLSPNPLTRAVEDALTSYCCITHQPVYLSWLGPRETWSGFRRNFLLAVEDPRGVDGGALRYVIPERKGKGRRLESGRVRSGGRIKSTRFSGLEVKKGKGKGLGKRGGGRGSS